VPKNVLEFKNPETESLKIPEDIEISLIFESDIVTEEALDAFSNLQVIALTIRKKLLSKSLLQLVKTFIETHDSCRRLDIMSDTDSSKLLWTFDAKDMYIWDDL